MLDISISYNKFKFLGYEFMTWLWFAIEEDKLINTDKKPILLEIGNRIVFENSLNNTIETIIIKGDEAGLEEGILALKKGAVVTELNLVYKENEQKWQFTLKGENLNIAGIKTPDTGNIEKQEDIEGVILEKVYLYNKVVEIIDTLFKKFIKIRLSNKWNDETVPLIRNWINS